MKWFALIALLGAALLLASLIRSDRCIKSVWMLVGFLPCVIGPIHLYMAVVSWPDWPGYSKGLELNVIDALALSLYLGMRPKSWRLPFRIPFALYISATALSAVFAIVPEAVLFYLWQLLRSAFLYFVIVNACARPVVPIALLNGMAAGLFLQAVTVLWQRFGLHVLQASGTFGHQNELGMISHFMVFPFFALLLTGRVGRWPAFVLPAGAIVELMTTSRATIGLAVLGYVLVFALSAIRGWTFRKGVMLAAFLASGMVIAPYAISALAARGATEIEESDNAREAFKRAASMMLAEHPLGVGANNFVVAANMGEYYEAAGVGWTEYTATVHNFYWLTACEMGYVGLVACVALLLCPLGIALVYGMRYRKHVKADLLIGLGVGVLLAYVQSLEEWVFVTDRVQQVYVIVIGLIAGFATEMGYGRRGIRHVQTPFRPAPVAADVAGLRRIYVALLRPYWLG